MQKKYVIYARVSTVGQEQGTSLDTQVTQCRELVEQQINGVVIAVYKEAISGGLYLSRMKLQAALGQIENGEADGLVMFDMERFARHAAYQEIAVERIERVNGEIHFCRDHYDNSPEGKLVRGIRGQVAQYFREKQSILCKEGHLSRATSGVMPLRSLFPFGYGIVQQKDVENGDSRPAGTYYIIEEQAKWVRFIFQQRSEGRKLQEIANALNVAKVRTARKAKKWTPGVIHAILTNPVHKGMAVFGEYKVLTDDSRITRGLRPYYRIKTEITDWVYIPAPPIVPAELWQKCQRK